MQSFARPRLLSILYVDDLEISLSTAEINPQLAVTCHALRNNRITTDR